MIKAYLFFDNDDTLNIGSSADGMPIKDYILNGSEQDDDLYINLHQIPQIGQRIFIGGVSIELEVIDIYHHVSIPFDWNENPYSNHVVKLLCKTTKLSDWKKDWSW